MLMKNAPFTFSWQCNTHHPWKNVHEFCIMCWLRDLAGSKFRHVRPLSARKSENLEENGARLITMFAPVASNKREIHRRT